MNKYLLVLLAILSVISYTQVSKSDTLDSDSVKVDAGWNLMSLPVKVTEGTKNILFPSAVSSAFIYQTGYLPKDTLENGPGFWLKFDSVETIAITGEAIYNDTIEVHTGWNMIGSISTPVPVDSIKCDPPDLIISNYFNYKGGTYRSTDTLQPGSGYWVKVNQNGVIILSVMGMPCPGMPTVEYAEKTYNTVQIGDQCWLKENLNVGTMIAGVDTQKDNSTIEMYCYNDDPVNCDTYGGLYQWSEAMQYSTTGGAQGICPSGWHIPTYAEFLTLSATIGGDGNALKAKGQGTGAGAGTNTSGFSALLSGNREGDGYFGSLGTSIYFWSSSEYDTSYAYTMYLFYHNSDINVDYGAYKDYGFSVRCVKGEGANSPPYQPLNPSPLDNESNVYTDVDLQWSCSDPDNDPLAYNIYFGTDNPPATVVSSNQTDTNLIENGLNQGATYYWKVVSKDSHGDSAEGPVWRFTTQTGGGSPCPGMSTVTYEGKKYHTVQIVTQCWLRENLDVGTMIQGIDTAKNNGIIEKYCYNNESDSCYKYGGLYNWNEAMQYINTPGTRGICPPSWHIPTVADFQILSTAVGGDGNALKAIGEGIGDGAGTNTSGFSALFAGDHDYNGNFFLLGKLAYIWSSTENDSYAHDMTLYYDNSINDLYSNDKELGLSVRCIKD